MHRRMEALIEGAGLQSWALLRWPEQKKELQEQEGALKSIRAGRRHRVGHGVDGLRVLVVDDSKATR